MNRVQRRAMSKQLRSKGYNDKQIAEFFDSLSAFSESGCLQEGDKVRLDYGRITAYAKWPEMQQRYKDFVEIHKDDIFTVEYDPKYTEKHVLVCLKEDDSPAKWLWHERDVILVEEANETNQA